MANPYVDTPSDIHKRIYTFILGCFQDVIRVIPKSPEHLPLIKQLAASLTSIGANDQEADASESKKDFVAKYTIVKKEAKETVYWLSIVRDLQIVPIQVVQKYVKESDEILRIVSKIILNTKQS